MQATVPTSFSPGDWIVYCKTKFSRHPGPRARGIQPTEHGDGYVYMVDKYWVVDEVLGDGRLKLRTRRGKVHTVQPHDLCLRRPTLWERLIRRNRFEEIEENAVAEAA